MKSTEFPTYSLRPLWLPILRQERPQGTQKSRASRDKVARALRRVRQRVRLQERLGEAREDGTLEDQGSSQEREV